MQLCCCSVQTQNFASQQLNINTPNKIIYKTRKEAREASEKLELRSDLVESDLSQLTDLLEELRDNQLQQSTEETNTDKGKIYIPSTVLFFLQLNGEALTNTIEIFIAWVNFNGKKPKAKSRASPPWHLCIPPLDEWLSFFFLFSFGEIIWGSITCKCCISFSFNWKITSIEKKGCSFVHLQWWNPQGGSE